MHLLAHFTGDCASSVPPPRLYVVREKNARCSLLPLFYSQVLKNLSHFLHSQTSSSDKVKRRIAKITLLQGYVTFSIFIIVRIPYCSTH